MPDSQELDDILNEIKSMSSDNPDNDTKKSNVTKSDELNINELFSQPERKQKAENTVEEKKQEKKTNNSKEGKKMPDKKKNAPKKNKFAIFAAVAILAIVIISVIVFIAKARVDVEETTAPAVTVTQAEVTEAELPKVNPLTGSADFNEKAVGRRPIACVVENAQAARPQWGIADSTNPPDIIVEGEVEGGETRMLFMYADYTAVPSQIGPMRSARPPYIKFSELFDAIFIHWGMSQTKKGTAYIGANTVFRQDNVDHINQMTYSGVALFGRDSSRGVSSEHTGVLYGAKIEEAIKGEGFRTEADNSHYTKFSFAQEESRVSDKDCSALALTFSSRTRTRDWTFSDEDKMYHSSDYKTDVARKNLLVLFDTTEYISKPNYKGKYTEVYCNYNLAGGDGKLATNGSVVDIKWSVENGVLVIKDAQGNNVNFNVGTTWIGYASSNNGGSVTAE